MPLDFTAIAAMAANRVIGRDNQLPWRLPEELKWFKATTMGHALIMGRKTFLSIGRPLPGRRNIVLSRTGFSAPGVEVVDSLEAITADALPRRHFIIGGESVYRAALDRCSELLLTHVHMEVEGDAVFPAFEGRFEAVEELLRRPEFHIVRYLPKPVD